MFPFFLLSKTNQPINLQTLPDIGGGSVSNKTRHSLARIPLRWMVRECFKADTGIMFNSSALQEELGMDPSSLYPYVTPRPPPLPLSPGINRIRSPPAKEIPIRARNYLKKKTPLVNDDAEPEPDMHTLIEKAMKDAKSKVTPPLSEEEEELHDALSPKYDQLKIQKAWWIVELIPLYLRYQRGDNQWVSYFAWVFSFQTLGFVLLTDNWFLVGRTRLVLD